MPFTSLSETESFIKNLDEEAKQKLLSTISFMLINNISQENNIDAFSLIQKLSGLIPSDSQKKFLLEFNSLVIQHLSKNNIDILPIINSFTSLLNEESKKKFFNGVDFIINNNLNNINVKITQPGFSGEQNIKKGDTPPPLLIKNNIKDNQTSQTNHLTSNLKPPPPPPPIINNRDTNQPLLKHSLVPNVIENKLVSSNPNKHNTSEINTKISEDSIISTMPVKEALKYIIPLQTDLGRKALSDISTPNDVYQFLKVAGGAKTLEQIHLELYPQFDLMNFVSRVHNMFNKKYILLKKAVDFPGKDMRLKIGEWLVMFGYLEEDKLNKIVKLHALAVKNNETNNRRFAAKTLINGQPVENKGPLFGNFLIESEIINRDQLTQALLTQSQYNEIITNVK